MDVTPELRFETAPTYGRVPTAAPLMTAGEIRDRLVGERFESAAHVAVVDDDRLVGLARLEDVLAAPSTVAVGELIDLASTSSARHATEEPVKVRLGHRLPWLLLGLLGAVASAQLLDAFGSELERDMLIAFFISGVVYMADAIGTQTETLVVRGLSVGVSIGGTFRRELLTGALIGLALAIAFLPIGVACGAAPTSPSPSLCSPPVPRPPSWR